VLKCFVTVREKHAEINNKKQEVIILNDTINDHNRYSLIKDNAVNL
jgi:hypothetical protein